VTALTVKAMPAASLAGITLIVDGRARTAVFTDPTAPEIDQAQYISGAGPCLDAYRERTLFVVDSTDDDERWPTFCAAAAARGVHSALALPLMVGDRSVGAMNLYAEPVGAFGAVEQETAMHFADHAAVVLANALAYWDAFTLSERLGGAMRNRAVIEQAKGMLMAAQRCDEDTAFELLVRASQRENVKLREIAQRIVADATQRSAQQADGPGDVVPT
jgi:GAF domain-containing protein